MANGQGLRKFSDAFVALGFSVSPFTENFTKLDYDFHVAVANTASVRLIRAMDISKSLKLHQLTWLTIDQCIRRSL